jgi:cell division protein FtsZ
MAGKGSKAMADNAEIVRFFIADDEPQAATKIKVVGVGGGGSNAVACMQHGGLNGVEFYIMNTDRQDLEASPVKNKLAIGGKLTNGFGAGGDPNVGRQAALDETDHIIGILEGADMVFVTAGLGGGTGTGAGPVVASLAKELNALTVAIVTLPFEFEGRWRARQAERGLAELANACDTVIGISNEKLIGLVPEDLGFADAFRAANDILRQAVGGITEIALTPGLVNRDFADIRSIMLGSGHAMLGTASAKGPDAATEAARLAISSPLMDEGGIAGAKGLLIHITAGKQLRMRNIMDACGLINAATQNEEARVSWGISQDERLGDEVKVTVIATGFQKEPLSQIDRRSPHFPFTAPIDEHAAGDPVITGPVAVEPRAPEPEPGDMEEAMIPPLDDFDTPAIVRKRRLLQ